MSDVLDWKTGWELRKVNDFTFVEVADALFGAADLVEQQGWTQKRMFGPVDRDTGARSRCARGAINDACDVYSLDAASKPRKRALRDVVERALWWWLVDQGAEVIDPSWFEDMLVPEWNDVAGRTQQDVVAALRGCAEWVKAGDDGDG